MTWTADACRRMRETDGIVDVSLAESTDGLPFSKSFRAEAQLESKDEQAAVVLLESILRCVYETAGRKAPRGSVGLFVVRDGVRSNLHAKRLQLPDGLRGWGSSISVPEGWLHQRFGQE